MSIFAISDLHLAFGNDKPMDVFRGWENYTEKIKANWNRLVTPQDTVVLPGDFSWCLKLTDTKPDFEFLKTLNGKKILLKGNHDLWWSTYKKVNEFLSQNGFSDVSILFNNTVTAEGFAIAGTRGWLYDAAEDDKVIAREAGRLERSLAAAKETGLPILVFLHYPPVYGDQKCTAVLDVLKKYNIETVYHGHIHGNGCNNSVSEYDGIKFRLISCDCIDYTPLFIC